MSHLLKAASTSSPSLLTHEAVVHKYAGQLTAYGLRHQRRRHRGIHAAGEGQQHLAVPHLLPDLTDGNILHNPPWSTRPFAPQTS